MASESWTPSVSCARSRESDPDLPREIPGELQLFPEKVDKVLMGNIANKRGGGGGRNAPPTVYTPFCDWDDGPDADPIGAVLDIVKFFVWLCVVGLLWWIIDRIRGKQ